MIINDILDFSKIEAGKFTLDRCEFDLDQIVQEIMRMMAVPAHEKSLELLYENRTVQRGNVLGDPGRLRQVVVNLIGNAVKFTESGEVSVAVVSADEEDQEVIVHFAISDTGVGVSPEWKQRIFEPFVQVDGSHTRSYGGTGLGLSICARLVGFMGGRMWVDSESGRGSTFHFTVKLSMPPASVASVQHTEMQALCGMDVLVVDDNATSRRILHEILIGWKMNPVLAPSACHALDIARRRVGCGERFGLYLLDARMPEMDGFTLSRQIQEEPALAGPRVMMLSSVDIVSIGPELRSTGHYLVKPVTPSTLLSAILKVLGEGRPRAVPVPGTVRAVRGRPLRVLLAEDNAVNQKVAARFLERQGHSVEVTSNGAEALAAYARDTFDLILMDVQMPVMNGYDATLAIRALRSGVPAATFRLWRLPLTS